jgi:hypothetical protein
MPTGGFMLVAVLDHLGQAFYRRDGVSLLGVPQVLCLQPQDTE